MNSAPVYDDVGLRSPDEAVLALGNIALSRATYELTIGGRPVYLSRLEFDLLLMFLRHPGRVMACEEISQTLWKRKCDESLLRLNTAVHRLRVKLAGSSPYEIRTVRRPSYGLLSSVSAPDEPTRAEVR